MKKIKSKLFQEFKLESSEIVKVIGGVALNTTCGSDTNHVGGGYDVIFETCTDGVASADVTKTESGTTTDKPNC